MTKIIYNLKEAEKSDALTLGGKGFYVSQLNKLKDELDLDFSVPDARILSTDLWQEYSKSPKKTLTKIKNEIVPELLKNFKDKNKLYSIRSGAPVSMPGMMDTVLNFGINVENVDVFAKKNKEWAYDCLKRYLLMYGSIVLDIPKDDFKSCSKKTYISKEEIIKDFDKIYKKHKKQLPDNNLEEQLYLCIEAVLKSWNSERAVIYRDMNNIDHYIGTAVIMQEMVFGNKNDKSATAVIFSRDITTGDSNLVGEFLINAQGEDVVSGSHTPKNFYDMEYWNKDVFSKIKKNVKALEKYFKDVQDIELTIEDGKIYFLQTRTAKRTAQASVKIAIDFVNEGVIDQKEVFSRVKLNDYLNLNVKKIDENYNVSPNAKGLPASNGVMIGPVVFDLKNLDDIEDYSNAIFLAKETTPDDMPIMKEVGAIFTASGGITSHAAVVARSLNKICVVGSNELKIHQEENIKDWYATIGGIEVRAGDLITIDGFNGNVWVGDNVPINDGANNKNLLKLEDMFFDTFPAIRVVSNSNDIFSDKDTIYTTYLLDDCGPETLKESLFNAMDVMQDFCESDEKSVKDYVAVIDLRGKTDFSNLFSDETPLFAENIGIDSLERKISILEKYSGDRTNFYIYLGKYEKEYKDKLEHFGYKILNEKNLDIRFNKELLSSKEIIQVVDKVALNDLNNKSKIAISAKNALISTLK